MAKAPSAGRRSGNVVQVLTRSPMADHHLIIFATVILTAIGAMMVLSSSSVIALFQGSLPIISCPGSSSSWSVGCC